MENKMKKTQYNPQASEDTKKQGQQGQNNYGQEGYKKQGQQGQNQPRTQDQSRQQQQGKFGRSESEDGLDRDME